jgi:hypothetical protein
MSIGWHLSMRTALKEMGFIIDDRKPFKQVSEEQKNLIKTKLQNLL